MTQAERQNPRISTRPPHFSRSARSASALINCPPTVTLNKIKLRRRWRTAVGTKPHLTGNREPKHRAAFPSGVRRPFMPRYALARRIDVHGRTRARTAIAKAPEASRGSLRRGCFWPNEKGSAPGQSAWLHATVYLDRTAEIWSGVALPVIWATRPSFLSSVTVSTWAATPSSVSALS